jgi:hypothetical protein
MGGPVRSTARLQDDEGQRGENEEPDEASTPACSGVVLKVAVGFEPTRAKRASIPPRTNANALP